MTVPPAVDLFGRTEAELVGRIALQKRFLEGSANGGDARRRANLAVDERQLAQLRGERVVYPDGEEPPPPLAGQALAKWRKDILALDRRPR